MAKINRFATNEIEGQASAVDEINPLGMHYDTDGAIFFSNGAASSKKFIAPGKIYGSGSDSVSGKDTLKLIPDSDTFDSGTDQYIVIDAASPNGIHIRAGGGLNASTSSLYLGGDKNFIKIDEATNNITIGTGGTDVNTEWVFGGTGTLNYSTGLSFTSPYPISLTANLNANSFISTSSSASFDGGTGWSYEISITVSAVGIVSVNVDTPIFTSNTGYKDGDTFRFGTAIHGIRGFDLDLTLQNITQITTGPDTFVANLVPAAIPPLESTITSAKPVKITSGTSNFILGTDGSIRFENGALLSEVMQASRNAFRLITAQDTDTALFVYTTTSGGNSAVITTTSLTDEALVIGESNQSIRLRNDGNIDIATVNRATSASTTWKLTSLGRIASQDDSLYLQQSTFEFTDPGLFYYGSNNLRLSADNDVIITAGGTSNFRFTGSNEIKFENNSVVTGTTWLGTYPALKLTTDLNNPDLGLAFYTSTGSGNVVYVVPVNETVSGMAVGTSQHQFKLAQEGDSSILSRTGILADIGNSIAASRGGNVYITAGAAGDNAGDPNFGAEGGHLFLESGYSTLTDVAGGSIVLKTGSGYGGFGNVKIEISDKTWTFDKTGNIILPQTAMNVSPAPVSLPGITFTDGTRQITAFTGSSAKVDIVNTNGLTTTYYPTFVEDRTNSQEMRADVDLTYRTDDNLLRSGNIQVGHNIYGSYRSGLSNAIQFRPNIDLDKRFLFTVDSSGGTYVRSSMEMPSAEVDKAVTLAFPHLNSNAGYIYVQGADSAGTEFNNAFNIMMNSGNVKISALSGGGNKVWNFTTSGQLIYPDATVQTTAFNGTAAPNNISTGNIVNGTSFTAYGITVSLTGPTLGPWNVQVAVAGSVGGDTYINSTAYTGGISTTPTSITTFANPGQSTTALISDMNNLTMFRVTVQMVSNVNMNEVTLVVIEKIKNG